MNEFKYLARKTASPSTLPPAPSYGETTLNSVLPSVDAALAGWHGSQRTCSDAATPLIRGVPQARRAVVVMVDGLGEHLLRRHAGHAPTLRRARQGDGSRVLDTVFPTTTAAALTAFGTGLAPSQHGIVGYDAVATEGQHRRRVNQLGGWPQDLDPETWQPHPTCFERMESTRRVVTVSRNKFADSSLTRSSLRGGAFVGVNTPHARVQKTVEQLKAHGDIFVYLYWDDLDKVGHSHGSDSERWLHELEELDAAMKRLIAKVPGDTLVVLTADHGMVDVPVEGRIDYSRWPELVDGVELTAGEPRGVQLHFQHDVGQTRREANLQAWKDRFGDQAWVLTREEYTQLGWFGPEFSSETASRAGDVLIAAHGPIALYDGRRVNPQAFNMIGQHGSLTDDERHVPFLILAN